MTLLTDILQIAGRQSRLTRIGLYAAFGFAVFFIALYASIPRDRLRERLERELSQDPTPTAPMGLGMDVTIGDLGLSLISPGLRASEVTLKQRVLPSMPLVAGKKPASYFIDSFDARAPILDLLIGRKVIKIDMSAFTGSAAVEAGLGGEDSFAKARGEHVAIALLPGVAQAAPIPVGGNLDFTADLKAPLDKRTQRPLVAGASGLIEFTIEDAVLGNGKAKLVVPGDPFLAQGLTVPRLRLGKVSGKLVVEKGRATVAELHTKSPDGEISLEGYIELRDPFPFSELHLYLRFRPSPDLLKREGTLELMVGAMSQAKRPDGSIGISITGTAGVPQARPSKEPPVGVTAHGTLSALPAASSPPAATAAVPPPAPIRTQFPPPAAAIRPPPQEQVAPPAPVVDPGQTARALGSSGAGITGAGAPDSNAARLAAPALSPSVRLPPIGVAPSSSPAGTTPGVVAPPPISAPSAAEPPPAAAAAPAEGETLATPPPSYPVNQKGE